MADTYTAEARLCDDVGMVSDERVASGSPGTTFEPELTYGQLLNNLRKHTGLPPYVGEPFRCTGSAHLAREHFRCTNPIHADPSSPAVPADECPWPVGTVLESRGDSGIFRWIFERIITGDWYEVGKEQRRDWAYVSDFPNLVELVPASSASGTATTDDVYQRAALAALLSAHAGEPDRFAIVTTAEDPWHRAAVDEARRDRTAEIVTGLRRAAETIHVEDGDCLREYAKRIERGDI